MKHPRTQQSELLRWLHMQGPADRRILAQLWDLPPDADAEQITASLTQPARVKQQWERLSEAERAALTCVLQEGGSLPTPIMQREWGIVREPGSFAHPRAYLDALGSPASPAERLYLMGLLVRDHDDRGPVFRVLNDFRALLPRVEPRVRRLDVSPVADAPEMDPLHLEYVDQAVVALLQLAEEGLLQTLDDGALNKASLVKVAARIRPGENLRGVRREADWPWFALIRHAVVGAALLSRTTDGLLRHGPAAERWLKAPRPERLRLLVEGWIESHFNELTVLCGLSLRSTPFHLRLPESRRRLLDLLATLPAEIWLPVAATVAEVQQVDPDFLRRNGRYDGWLIYDGRGKLLSGQESWMLVEGVFVEVVIVGTLRWLGLVDAAGTERLDMFRLNALGAYLLQDAPLDSEPAPEPLVVQGTFEVICPPGATLWAHYQLGRIAEPVSDEAAAVYRLTRRSVLRAVEQGMTPEGIVGFLTENGRAPVPQGVASYIFEWSGQAGRLKLEEAALLRADDPLRLAELKRARGVDLPPLEELTPTAWKLSSGDVPALVQQLNRAGFSVDGAAETNGLGASSRKMSPSEHDLKALVTAAYAYAYVCAELELPCEVSSAMLMRLGRLVPSRHVRAAQLAAEALRRRMLQGLDSTPEDLGYA